MKCLLACTRPSDAAVMRPADIMKPQQLHVLLLSILAETLRASQCIGAVSHMYRRKQQRHVEGGDVRLDPNILFLGLIPAMASTPTPSRISTYKLCPRIHTSHVSPTLHPLLHTNPPPIPQRRRRPRCNVKSVLLLRTGTLLRPLHLRHVIQRLQINRRRAIIPLSCSKLVMFIAAPEHDIGAPVRVV